jgi:hypothetical protein
VRRTLDSRPAPDDPDHLLIEGTNMSDHASAAIAPEVSAP